MKRSALWISLALLPALSGCCACDPEGHARDLAGDGAIDCGLVPLGEDRETAITCAEDAIASGEPFLVGFGRQGRDSELRTYVTGAGDGTFDILAYDGGVGGGCARLTAFECTDTPMRTTDPFDGETLSCPSGGEGVTLCAR